MGGSVPEVLYPGEFMQPTGYRAKAPHIGHSHHLCTICETGDCTLAEFKELVKNPKFICKVCGRAAANADNLCEPVPL